MGDQIIGNQEFVRDYLWTLKCLIGAVDGTEVSRVIEVLFAAYKEGRRIFIIGNGGSASTASHLACDLAKGCAAKGKPRVQAFSLTDNVALITAIANDIAYAKVFTEQLAVLLERGDVVFAITASGTSPNILDAVVYAKERGATVVGLIGFKGGSLKALVDMDITVDSDNYGHVEDVHCALAHVIAQRLRWKIQGDDPGRSAGVP